MKQFLRLLLAAGIIAFAVSMTAVSCGKTADPNNNNNNNANNSGGDGGSGGGGDGGGTGGNGGGGTPQPPPGPPAIAFQNFDANAAKLVAGTGGALDTLRLKASAFPQTSFLPRSTYSFSQFNDTSMTPSLLKKVFEITITGGNAGAATGGLIMVGGGNIGSVNSFADLSGGVASSGTRNIQNTGFISAAAVSTAQRHQPAGWSYFGLFIDDTTPAVADADSQPFAFTQWDIGRMTFSHPIMFCRTTITTITSSATMGAGSIQANTTFAGGQTAHCFIGSKGANFLDYVANGWLGNAASATFKKTFNIAIGGIRTDAKTVKDFMPGTDDAAKITALRNGLNGREITEIIKTNPSAYKKVAVTIVSNAGF